MNPLTKRKISKVIICLMTMSVISVEKVKCQKRRESSRGKDCENVEVSQPKKYIQSPDYPRPSYPNTRCSWTVKNPNNHHVALNPVSLNVGGKEKDDDRHGYLEIYDGCFNNMFLVENISSVETSKAVHDLYNNQVKRYLWVSTGHCLTIKFDSGKGNGNKFLLKFEETTDVCGGTLLGSNGSIAVPPSLHSRNKECVWIISVPKGPRIEVKFEEFDVTSNMEKEKDQCKMDFVKIQIGRSSSSETSFRFCGISRPYPVYSNDRNLRITLTSAGEVAQKKLKASYRSVEDESRTSSKPCGGEMKQDEGIFVSPNFGDQYPKNLHCVWKIEVPTGNIVKLRFSMFDVEPGQGDCVQVFDGLASWAPAINEFCGRVGGQLPPLVSSTRNKMRVVFRSDERYGGRGFKAEYAAFDPNANLSEDSASHFTGIMIGTTCGIIFVVLTVLAVAHTRKVRLRRAQIHRTDVASTVSFDVHELNAPPSYETVMSAPDRFPNTPRQSQRSYSSRPQDPLDHREISHLLGSEDEDDEPPPPPYPGIIGQPILTPSLLESRSRTSLPPGYPSQELANTESKHELEDGSNRENSQIWQVRSETCSGVPESTFLLSQVNSEDHVNIQSGNLQETENQKENRRRAPPPPLERQDTFSSFVTDV